MKQAKQILIFDSGVGGLSIFEQITRLNQQVDCIYLFDNAYFPYGELEDDFLIKRLTELLLGVVEKHAIDLIVIACNSASTVALQVLRAHFTIPIVGVVPAIKPAAQQTKNGVIGLLATPATINREYTKLLIDEFAPDFTVLKIGSTALVKMAEQKLRGIEVDKESLQNILKSWLSLPEKPDVIVLGCTHFPLLKEEIAGCFEQQVQLVDPGVAVANRVNQLLGQQTNDRSVSGYRAYYTKEYNETEKESLAALKQSFFDYGFTELRYIN